MTAGLLVVEVVDPTAWIIGTVPRAVPWILDVPLHGTGVVRFSWLDCPGPALAHVVDHHTVQKAVCSFRERLS